MQGFIALSFSPTYSSTIRPRSRARGKLHFLVFSLHTARWLEKNPMLDTQNGVR
jgi:hypothetical protein